MGSSSSQPPLTAQSRFGTLKVEHPSRRGPLGVKTLGLNLITSKLVQFGQRATLPLSPLVATSITGTLVLRLAHKELFMYGKYLL